MKTKSKLLGRYALLIVWALMPFSAPLAQSAVGINLENPPPGARLSGVSVVSGWSCTAGIVEVSFDGGSPIRVPSGGTRGDTRGVCGRADTGFGLTVNFNIFGAGEHTIQMFADGMPSGNLVRFTVTVPGGDFIRGIVKSMDVPDFPKTGQTTRLDWQESIQNFAIVSSNGPGFQTTLDTFPILFEGVYVLAASVATTRYGDCDMTVRFRNVKGVPVDPFLYFDIVQGGVTTGQEIFHMSGVQPGVTAEDTTSVFAGGSFLECGTFQVRFNSAASSVFD